MIAKKNKILILLDGSEDSEKSLDFIINSKIVKFDQIVLFFILNPFNPVTKGQDKEVLYNDFVHDHGKRLATLYIEKIENFGKSFQELTISTVKAFLEDSKKSKFKI